MSGISEIQKQRIFEEITRLYFSSGVTPKLADILNSVSRYFAKNPVGLPLSIPVNFVGEDIRSNVDKFNEILAKTSLNLDVLYEASSSQVSEVMLLTTILNTQLNHLGSRRKRLEAQIDDYLFSLNNTDGYYYSSSDTFADTTLTDLNLSSAFVDSKTGTVTLPTVSSLTTRLSGSKISLGNTSVKANGVDVSYVVDGDFSGALDGLSNTAWSIKVSVDTPSELVCVVDLVVGDPNDPATVSRIDIDPFGISPVQVFIETTESTDLAAKLSDFGSRIQTSSNQMSFIDSPRDIQRIRLTLRKTESDYNVNENNSIKYNYIFGAKDIVITQHVYDNQCVFVSTPLSLPADLASDNIIDAVSIAVEDHKPADTSITYYVAADVKGDNLTLADFSWRKIEPLGDKSNPATSVIKFDGATNFSKFIKENPSTSDLQLIGFDSTNADLTQRNPSPSVIEGLDIYRIASFNVDILPSSISLEEGINSTRILHTTLNSAAVDSLSFWTSYINGTISSTQIFGGIDTGNEFFYGGDVGDSGRSVYVETYLDSIEDQEIFLKEIQKADPNSKQWTIKVFLNGREIGSLPVGTDRLTLPWKFQQGLNHIALLINIPEATDDYPHPYIGNIDLMGSANLYDFGSVKLGTWQYTDIFHLEFNETGQPRTFTIYNGEIISRRKPTTNFRLKYSTSTQDSPEALRVRADLSRSSNNSHISPSIDAYKLRFLYGAQQ